MDFTTQSYLFVTCAKGVEPVLEKELKALGCDTGPVQVSGVPIKGCLNDAVRLNLHLRTAHRVLFELAQFKARTPDDLYKKVFALPWEDIIPADGYLSVVSSVNTASITDSRYANLKVKDAVVDRIAKHRGSRPDSGPDRSGAVVSLHWDRDEVAIYLDTSGEPLSMRGYRKRPHTAPMRETLAAASLLLADYDGRGNLINPMCGSGTLAIEAALIATNTAPGLLRTNFGFMHLIGYDRAVGDALCDEALFAVNHEPEVRISASDHDPLALEATEDNAISAGMQDYIRISRRDFREAVVPPPIEDEVNLMICNPGYGKRLGEETELMEDYKAIGDFMKQHCQGYTGAIFTGNSTLAKRVGLRTRARFPMMNGPIECRLLLYALYSGSKKASKQAK